MSTEKAGGRVEKTVVRDVVYLGGMCPRCEGMGSVSDFDLTALYDESKSLNEGGLMVPGYSMDGWYGRLFQGIGLDLDKPIGKYTKKEMNDLLYKEPTKIKVEGINLTYEGRDPEGPEVDALQGRRRAAAARPALRRARDHVPDLPRVRRHAAHPGGQVVEDRGQEHRRPLRDADQRPRRLGPRRSTSRRSPRCSPGCSTSSTRSPRSGWATSRSTGRRARCPAARRSAPR